MRSKNNVWGEEKAWLFIEETWPSPIGYSIGNVGPTCVCPDMSAWLSAGPVTRAYKTSESVSANQKPLIKFNINYLNRGSAAAIFSIFGPSARYKKAPFFTDHKLNSYARSEAPSWCPRRVADVLVLLNPFQSIISPHLASSHLTYFQSKQCRWRASEGDKDRR